MEIGIIVIFILLFIIALPISIIVLNYNKYSKKRKEDQNATPPNTILTAFLVILVLFGIGLLMLTALCTGGFGGGH
ncbi:MAG: hypothetical protein DI598_08940 [Pseudopedobacter saltans]|uniref:Uncharacterized protein n=1 Tax=Pseudopedobacter saltans TaxID=151895 RepID=A0A2W5F0L3_9SPHI|nr:MAG: hypothetical protein DI598_08940 [Pseudopedobacter saltans]